MTLLIFKADTFNRCLSLNRTAILSAIALFFLITGNSGAGNLYVVTGSQGIAINSASVQMAYRFTVQSLTILADAQVYVTALSNPPSYVLALQQDNAGKPSGTDVISQSFTPTAVGWTTVNFSTAATLIPGNAYHIIVRFGSGTISANQYAAFGATTPLDQIYPLTGSSDPNANVLTNASGGWNPMSLNPVYILGTGGAPFVYEGEPYAVNLVKNIDGGAGATSNADWVSEKFIYTSATSTLMGGARVILQTVGSPSAPVSCLLTDETSSAVTVASGVVTVSSVAAAFNWVNVSLVPAFSFSQNHTYRLAFFTGSGSPGANSYQTSVGNTAAGNSIQTDLTFGGSVNGFLSTSIGGATWTDDVQSDLAFDFVPAAPTATPTPVVSLTAIPSPTPDAELYLDQNFFNPTQQSLGMDVRVDIAGQVKILIFNIAGEEVEKLADQQMIQGNYRFSWDGRNSAGNIVGNAVYFIVIEQPSGKMIRKIIVLK
jgi:hypothetical protein